ncbi:MAG: urea transporter, permease protein UrtC [Bacillota bacterium]|jgi:branched-chain amino acid transport system permease protein|nr:urea transporter, permease protein UrtC [Bacillota bacterium]
MKLKLLSKGTYGKPLCFLVIMALLVTLPYWSGEYVVSIMMLILLYMAMGQMWNLMAGYAGLLSLGMQAFIGIGGYSLAVFSTTYGLNIFVSILLGGIFSLIFAFFISPALFKMSGVYFAIGSWVVAESLLLWFSNWEFVRYAQGINITSAYQFDTVDLYYIALVVGVAAALVVYLLLRSKSGLALMAMRDNSSAAETLGIELYKTKLRCYLISSFMMGIIGGAMYLYQAYILPSAAFSIGWTVAVTFMVIIGGIGTMEGPIIGAVLYVLFNQYLYQFPGISMMILGVTAILIILVAPNGIMGTLHNKTGIEILSARRNVG